MLLKTQSLAHVRFSIRKPGIVIKLFKNVEPDSSFFFGYRYKLLVKINQSNIKNSFNSFELQLSLLLLPLSHTKRLGGAVALD